MPLFTDVTPLRAYPAFRRLWLGTMLSQTGGAMTTFAGTLQVYDLTRSTTAVGGLGVAAFVPLFLIALPGGSLADRVSRRRLLLVMTGCQTAVSALYFTQAVLGAGLLWPVYGLTAAASAIGAVTVPARRALIPALVPARQRASAMALNRISFQVTMIAGPVLGGVVTAGSGVKGCYLADTVSFAGALWGTWRLPTVRTGPGRQAEPGRDSARSQLAQTTAGLSHIRRSQVLTGTLLADLTATFFGLPLSLFPAINAARFGGNPRTLGLFGAAIGVGGLVSATFAGPVRHMSRQGLAMLCFVAVWGLAFAAFAVAPSLWLTLLALGAAGAADTFTVVLRGVIVADVTADEFRGRVSAAEYLAGAGGVELGSLEAGLVGSLTTPAVSALSGGLATVAGAVAIAVTLPGFRRYRAPAPESARRAAKAASSHG